MSYNNCYNPRPIEYYQQPDCPYCQIENYNNRPVFENYSSQPVVENFDLFGWWPWMHRKHCSCPDKKTGSKLMLKSHCPKDCRGKVCITCPPERKQSISK